MTYDVKNLMTALVCTTV